MGAILVEGEQIPVRGGSQRQQRRFLGVKQRALETQSRAGGKVRILEGGERTSHCSGHSRT